MFVHTEHLLIMFIWDFSSENKMRETGNSFSYVKASHSLTMCICINTLVVILWVYKGDTEMIKSERSFSYDKKKHSYVCVYVSEMYFCTHLYIHKEYTIAWKVISDFDYSKILLFD